MEIPPDNLSSSRWGTVFNSRMLSKNRWIRKAQYRTGCVAGCEAPVSDADRASGEDCSAIELLSRTDPPLQATAAMLDSSLGGMLATRVIPRWSDPSLLKIEKKHHDRRRFGFGRGRDKRGYGRKRRDIACRKRSTLGKGLIRQHGTHVAVKGDVVGLTYV